MTATERTGWRDMWPSQHHRQLGKRFPMCDVDALLYHGPQEPRALIDWKSAAYGASKWKINASINAQKNLANGYRSEHHPDGLPFFVAAYRPAEMRWCFWAVNLSAENVLRKAFPENGDSSVSQLKDDDARGKYRIVDELGFVRLEGFLRGLNTDQMAEAMNKLTEEDPPELENAQAKPRDRSRAFYGSSNPSPHL